MIKLKIEGIDADELFGNEAAELEEDELFTSYAVDRPSFSSLYSKKSRLKILSAYKGEGKSAVLRLIRQKHKTSDDEILVNIQAPDISPILSSEDEDEWQRAWKNAILRAIADEVGSSISFAWTEDSSVLVEQSERNGFKSRSILSFIIERLGDQHKHFSTKSTDEGIQHRISRYIGKHDIPIWVIIDDADQSFQKNARSYAKIAGLYSACKFLISQIPNLIIRTTARPNIWKIIAQKSHPMSHLRQYIFSLNWSDEDIRALIAKRIAGYYGRQRSINVPTATIEQQATCIELVFEAEYDWGNKKVPPHTILDTLSKNRPRWLIELGKLALNGAKKEKRDTIILADLVKDLRTFGSNRLDDLIAEFSPQCDQLGDIIAYFKGQEKTYSTKDLLEVIRGKIVPKVSPRIVGTIGTANHFDVAHFLYMIGFLSARIKTDEEGHFAHLTYANDPELLKQDQELPESLTWEVHPVYSSALSLTNFKPASGAKLARLQEMY